MNNSDTLGMNRKERRAAGFVGEHKYDWHAPSNIPSPEVSKESNELCDLQDCTIQEGVTSSIPEIKDLEGHLGFDKK